MVNDLYLLVVVFLSFEFLLSQILSWRNQRSWERPLPQAVSGLFDAEKYQKAKEYARMNYRLGVLISSSSFFVILLMLHFQGFAKVDAWVHSLTTSVVLQSLFYFGILGLASNLLSLPFSLYSVFVIEQKFGFNKMTVRLFVTDKIKTILLSVVLGGGLLAALTAIFYSLGDSFWWIGWFLVSAVSIFMAMFFTTLLLPLFNKLSPLESGELRGAIEKYAAKVQFPLTNIFVMDGSKRSTKANAFFSGIGHKKNIVLFDNLIQDLSTEEVTAVLAHEVGHYQMKHVFQGIALSVLQMGLLFFIFGALARNPELGSVLGVPQNSFQISATVFMFLYIPLSLIIRTLMFLLSRKNEYEADAYAARTFASAPLIEGLKKLSINHLSNLQPDSWYVFFNYSHPPLIQRMERLNAQNHPH